MGRHRGLRMAYCVVATAFLAGCATTIVPPATVAAPARVAVIDHGRHSSLLLERPDGSMVRYAYGEWDWYAEGRTGPGRALGALFLPSEAALGRMRMPGPLSRETAVARVREGFEDILIFEVEARRADRLAGRLDAAFRAGEGRRLHHAGFDLDFVPVSASYWLGRSSNLVMAEWLEELGCRVDNPGLLSVWRIAAQ